MKNSDLYKVAIVLKNVSMIKDGVKAKFAYGIAKNRGMIEAEVTAIDTARAGLAVFQREQQALAIKYCDKDENGKPIIKNDRYQGIDETDGSEFRKEFDALKAAHKKTIDDIDALLAEELKEEPKWHRIKLDDCPDGISGEEMTILKPMITDEEPEKK